MSVVLLGAIYSRQFTRPQQAILVAMADEVRRGKTTCYPSALTIGWKTGYCERQVRRIWQQLEQAGVLVRVGMSHYGTIVWRIDPTAAPAKPERQRRRTPDTIVSPSDDQSPRTSARPDPGHSASPPGHQVSDEPRNLEPLQENQRNTAHQQLHAPDGRDITDIELAAAERDALTAMQHADDELQRAKRRGRSVEIGMRQAAKQAAERYFLAIRRERQQRDQHRCVNDFTQFAPLCHHRGDKKHLRA